MNDAPAVSITLPPWLAAVLSVLTSIVAVWKLLPAATRAALELRYPRPVGLVRVLADLLPDLVGAARTGKYQVGEGKPRAQIGIPADLTRSQRVRIEKAGGEIARVKVESRVSVAPPAAPSPTHAMLTALERADEAPVRIPPVPPSLAISDEERAALKQTIRDGLPPDAAAVVAERDALLRGETLGPDDPTPRKPRPTPFRE